MKAELHWEGKALIARLSEMDLSGNESMGEPLRIISDAQASEVVLDCSQVPFIASPGIANLIKFIQHIRRNGGSVRLAALSPHVQRLLELVNLRKWVPFYGTVSDALEAAEKLTAYQLGAGI